MNDIGVIKLTNGGFTIVDADLFQELNKFKWQKNPSGHIIRCTSKNGFRKTEYLHKRVLVLDNPNLEVDHINGCSFDNTTRNLRPATEQQNSHNRKKEIKRKTSSKYKGVCWNKRDKKWQAYV